MNLRLLFAILVAVACCGCDAEPTAPTTTSQQSIDATETPISGSTPTRPSSAGDNNPSRESIDAHLNDDQQPYVSFPAAGVKVVRPDGFDDAENFHGFQQPRTQSSVLIATIPGPYSETTREFTAEQLEKRGMTLLAKEAVEIDGDAGVLLSVLQNAYGTMFSKWILAFGNANETRMVTATFPVSEEANLSSELKSVLLSTQIDDTVTPTPGANVGFSIATSEKLKLTNVSSIGKLLAYTKDGIIPAKSPTDPLFIAAPSLSKIPIDNMRQFAVERLFQIANTKISSVTSNNEITIDGLEGYELVAIGEHSDSATPLRVYQVILYDDGSYILMQGLVRANDADQYLPEFKRLARSLARHPE